MSFLTQYPHIKTIQELAKHKKVKAYLVGGFLRDFFLNRPCLDFDFAIEKGSIPMARQFSKKIRGAFVLLDEEHGCARVVKKYHNAIHIFDFADFRAKGLKGDLAHRDFTVNTLAVDLRTFDDKRDLNQILIDLKGSLKDLKTKRIRMVSAKCFKEDPLRLLRAFSLRAMLDFRIENKTLAKIKKDKELLPSVSMERVREELFKILASERAAVTLKEMDKTDLLVKVIPQITVMYNVKQGGYHHLDVWPHSLQTVVELEKLLEELKDDTDVNEYLDEEIASTHTRRALLKLAALLHDIGKPETRKKDEDGRISFHGHEHVGRAIVRHIAKQLKFSTHERFALEDMVLWHLRPGYLGDFKQPSERAIFRFFRDAKEEAASVLLLSLADQRATRGPLTTEKDQKHHEKICMMLLQRYFEKKKEKPFVRLINGHDLIKKLKLTPSPLFAKILREVEENQVLGKITTKEEALELARKIAKNG